jgi:uncharacterized protein involved in exopolysaccharide biosynthesis/MinD-like ATPase involved in chromosome partitioning or flagellar assembly
MIRQHIFRTILFALIGFGVGLAILAFSKKVYEGRAQLVVGTQAQNAARVYGTTLNEDVATILQSGLAINPATEVMIIRGEGVFRQALEKVAVETNKTELRAQADDLYDMYDVVSTQEATEVLVRARAYDAETATALANAIADAYNERRQTSQREAVSAALAYLEGQIAQEKSDLNSSEVRLKEMKEELGLPEVSSNIRQDVEYQAQLRANLDTAKAELAAVDKSIGEIAAEMNNRPKSEPADYSEQKSNTLISLENTLADLNRQRQAALVHYYEDADSVKFIDGQIASVKKQISDLKRAGFENMVTVTRPDSIKKALEARLADAKVARQAVQERVNAVEAVYAQQTAKVNKVPASVLKLTEVARDAELKENNYKRLMVQYEDLKNRTETAARAAQIVYQATPNPNPVLPKPILVYVVSILGGAIFGLLLSFAVEAMRLRIYSSSQLQEITGLPVAGVVHDLPGPTARRLLSSIREPNPVVSESYRFLAFAAMSNREKGSRKILVTGIDNNAGCSTTAGQFATALAQSGSRVVLADCALEDPTLTKVFGLEQKSGVSDILSQTQLPSPDSIPGSDTAVPNLRVVGAGTEARNMIKTASTQNINGMIDALASHGDVLVIDSLPCLSSSDAARLVPYVDEVYLVVSAKTANMRNVAAAIDVLTLASAASIKFILTKGSRAEEAVMKQAGLASARV